ncbi:RNA polymerase sigma factor [Streptomyces sp. NPDC059382]|uniref:RNA polymerase sigma factor n=1 Tax=Streptomyces sp. NPDC059382 TaxID=3346816 RepID=UPI00367A2A67
MSRLNSVIHSETEWETHSVSLMAFEAFLQSHSRQMYRIAYSRLHDMHDAEEAVQDAALIIYRKWDRILAHPNSTALAFRIVSDAVIDRYRKRTRQGRTGLLPPDHNYFDGPAPDSSTDTHELLELVWSATDRLPSRQAEVIRLSLAGLANHEIAKALDIAPPTVSIHLRRGTEALRGLLKSHVRTASDPPHHAE